MTNKENILSAIRKNKKVSYPMPSFADFAPVQYENKLEQFIDSVQLVGGHAVILKEGEDVNILIRSIYPDESVVASSLAYINADINPDTVEDPKELNGTGVGVVEGDFAVAENGCVWIPQTMKERAVLFISECLVIIVKKDDIVNNMHEAYERVKTDSYGCFISGPSKTADIAQALVMGAQAARDVTVIII